MPASRISPDTFAVWLAGVLPEYRQARDRRGPVSLPERMAEAQGYRFLRTHVRNSNRAMLKILVDKGYQIVDVVRYGDMRRNKIVFVKNLWGQEAAMTAGPLIIGLFESRRNPLLEPPLQPGCATSRSRGCVSNTPAA